MMTGDQRSNRGFSLAMATLIALAAVFSSVLVVQALPQNVEIRCGDGIFGGATNVTLSNGSEVPEGMLLQVIDNGTKAVISVHVMGEGMAPNPGDGRFIITVNADTDDFPQPVFIRAFDNTTVATAMEYGDSAAFTINGAGPYDIAGWTLDTPITPTGTGDVGSASSGGRIAVRGPGAPIVTGSGLRLNSSSGGVGNQQVDVLHEYFFEINVTELKGVNNLREAVITAWHDQGDDNTPYGAGVPNTQFAFKYDYENDAASIVSTVNGAEPEVWLTRNATETVSGANDSSVRVYFMLGQQIRHAPGDGVWTAPTDTSTTAGGFNDINSWNFCINVTNKDDFSTAVYDEFGVYRWTAIHTTDLDITADGMPGQSVAFSPLTVNYSTNDRYHFSVYVNNTLQRVDPPAPADSIPETNLRVSGGYTPSTAFAGTGPANAVNLYDNRSAHSNGTYQLLPVYFTLYIPLNTLGGYYQGDIVYTVEQS